jgi:hypothetical protein
VSGQPGRPSVAEPARLRGRSLRPLRRLAGASEAQAAAIGLTHSRRSEPEAQTLAGSVLDSLRLRLGATLCFNGLPHWQCHTVDRRRPAARAGGSPGHLSSLCIFPYVSCSISGILVYSESGLIQVDLSAQALVSESDYRLGRSHGGPAGPAQAEPQGLTGCRSTHRGSAAGPAMRSGGAVTDSLIMPVFRVSPLSRLAGRLGA